MTTRNDDAPTTVLRASAAGSSPAAPVGRPSVKRIVVVASAAAVLVGGSAVAAYTLAGDVPRGTRVLGLDLGAKSRSVAERALQDAFGPRAAEPVRVDLMGERLAITPESIAMTLDVDATVGQALQGSAQLWGHHDVAPVIDLDQDRLEAVLRDAVDPKAVTLTRPGITYAGLTPTPRYGRAGRNLDPAAAAVSIRAAWLTAGTATVGLTERPPASSREAVDRLLTGLAEPAVAAPVTVEVGDDSFTLTPAMIARCLVFRSDQSGRLTPMVDPDRLHAAAADAFAKVERPPKPPTVTLSGGRPEVVPGSPGTVVDLNRLGPALLAVLSSPAPRKARAALVPQQAPTGSASPRRPRAVR